MRVEMTPAERRFWNAVRGSQLGVDFRRQQVIGGFIVDFYCASLKRVIEIDGEIHDDHLAYDRERDQNLQRQGIRIMRFANEHIVDHLPQVLAMIREVVHPLLSRSERQQPTPSKGTPLPKGEGLGEGS
jgi:very-short-patch-repair endonuclease